MRLQILAIHDGPGFPRDYQRARLRGWRARAPTPPPGEAWLVLLRQARHFYPGFDPDWRREFAALVALLEARALFTAARLSRGGEPGRAAVLLEGSLLAEPLRAGALSAPVELQLASALTAAGVPLALAPSLREEEAALYDALLSAGTAEARSPAVRETLSRLIDLRNLLALHKALRWVGGEPPLLPGGTLPSAHWLELWRRRDLAGAQRLASRLAGKGGGARADVADVLLQTLAASLRRQARDPLSAALPLDCALRLWFPASAGRAA